MVQYGPMEPDNAETRAETGTLNRELRRWCMQQPGTIKPGDLMREFRCTWSIACATLEELERDHVVHRNGTTGEWHPGPVPFYWRRDRQRRNATNALKSPDDACAVCGWYIHTVLRSRNGTGRGVHHHHIVPVSCGGTDDPDNLILLCPNCHALAHNLYPKCNGRYHGPVIREELAVDLRAALDDPEQFVAAKLSRLVDLMGETRRLRTEEWRLMPLDEPPARVISTPVSARPPAKPERRTAPLPPVKVIRVHVQAGHPGPAIGCRLCTAPSIVNVAVCRIGAAPPALGRE